jgi:hypothetical protein
MEYQIKQFRDSRYYVSTDGEVFTKIKKGLKKRKGSLNVKRGYYYVYTAIGEEKKFRTVHRMVAEAFLGPSKLVVNHKNGVRTDNRLENLEYCTYRENALHAINVLGSGRGEKHSQSRLTEEDVAAIRKACGTLKEIAAAFGVSYSHVCSLRRGAFWAHSFNAAEVN